jgi:hypothetical protein
VQVRGWQGDLIKHNPGLAHWHWDPIYSYKQGVEGGIKRKAQESGNPRSANQQSSNQPSNQPAPPRSYKVTHYVKPIHVPFNPKAQAEVMARTNHSLMLSQPAISDRVQLMKQPPKLQLQAPFTYEQMDATSDFNSNAASAAVKGRLTTNGAKPQGKRAYAGNLTNGP